METDLLLSLFRPSVMSNTLETPMESSSQDYCIVFPCPPLGNLPDSGIKTMSLHLLHLRQILYCLSHQEACQLTNTAYHVFFKLMFP